MIKLQGIYTFLVQIVAWNVILGQFDMWKVCFENRTSLGQKTIRAKDHGPDQFITCEPIACLNRKWNNKSSHSKSVEYYISDQYRSHDCLNSLGYHWPFILTFDKCQRHIIKKLVMIMSFITSRPLGSLTKHIMTIAYDLYLIFVWSRTVIVQMNNQNNIKFSLGIHFFHQNPM